ncbi:ATP-binding protein [Streptomyces hygroscopicus]|uniref:ATP-binding protein n=1 Tax=Streptomyces hygroscopicus TaxID=1912 RepID=UPI002AD35D7B|nr:ATP-binding protein [Streptomyces hygroscopicus]
MELPHPEGESPAAADGQGADRKTVGCAYHLPPGDCAPGNEASWSASPVTSAASARAHVLGVMRGHGDTLGIRPAERAVIDLLLVTSELVSNAIRHGGGLVAFEATPTPAGVRLRVHDHSADIPCAAYGSGELPSGHEGGGYGWPLIIRLARDIAVERCPGGGKTVSVLVPLVAESAPLDTGTPGVAPTHARSGKGTQRPVR